MNDDDKPWHLWDKEKGEPTPAQIDSHLKTLRPPSTFEDLLNHFKRISESDEYDDREDKYQGLMLNQINLLMIDYQKLKEILIGFYKKDRNNSPWAALSYIDQIMTKAVDIGMASEAADARRRGRIRQAEEARSSPAAIEQTKQKESERELALRVAAGAGLNKKGEIKVSQVLINKVNAERKKQGLPEIGNKTVRRHLGRT